MEYEIEIIEKSETVGLGTDLIFELGKNYAWRTAARIIMLALFSLLAAITYYGKPGIVSLLIHLILGAVCGLVYVSDAEFGLPATILLVTCAYTLYEITPAQEETGNV